MSNKRGLPRLFAFVGTVVAYCCLLTFSRHSHVTVKMRWNSGAQAMGQFFWSTRGVEFSETNSKKFPLAPRRDTEVTLTLPTEMNELRFDPTNVPGNALIEKISLSGIFSGFPIQRWDIENHFKGILPKQDVQIRGLHDGGLDLVATGYDSIFHLGLRKHFGLYVLIERVLISLFVGLLTGFLTWSALLFGRNSQPEKRSDRKPIAIVIGPKTLLFLGSSSIAITLAYLSYQPLLRFLHREDKNPLLSDPYQLGFVDRRGNPVSTRQGPLKIAIDPFVVFRPLPSQKTSFFTIDSQGFREAGGDKQRPIVFITGGSAAFGVGAEGDAQTFAAMLNQSQNQFNMINAGVPGWKAEQEYAYMTQVLDRFHPKGYISFSGWNEILNTGFPAGGQTFLEIEHNLSDFFLMKSGDSSAPFVEYKVTITPEVVDHAITEFFSVQERMAAFAKARGASFVLVLQPALAMKKYLNPTERSWLDGCRKTAWPNHPTFHQDYEKLVNTTISKCEKFKIRCIDLLHAPEFNDPKTMFFVDPVHLSTEGHQLVAEKLRNLP